MSSRRRIAIVDWHEKREFYAALTDAYPAEWMDVAPPTLAHQPPAVDLILVNDEVWPFCAAGIAEANRRSIPTLHLADGVCEWRNTWENPRPVPLFQPVLAARIACLGPAQARLIESWGNDGKCVVTGSPRFDALIGRRPRTRPPGTRPEILITTARQPAFNAAHREAVVASLRDVRDWFKLHHDCRLVWRLPDGLDAEVGVESSFHLPLAEQLAAVDAVICTPSTVILESMLCGLPVALLDYTNSPAYVTAAWTITAQVQLGSTLEDLLAPPPHRVAWQEFLLADQLACATPAVPRVIALIESMTGRSEEAGPPVEAAPRPPAPAQGRVLELEAEIAHLRRALDLRPSQVLYRAFCELKKRLRSSR